jgi:outer membrane protein OmpA-like peptidoglycan-associated protein
MRAFERAPFEFAGVEMNNKSTRAAAMVVATAAALATGCADMSERQKGTAIGAGVGAVAGAAVSKGTGGKAGTGAVVGGAIGAVAGNIWSRRMEEKRAAMERATQGTGIDVARTQDNQLKVNVPSDISFDVGRADIKPNMRPVLDQFAQGLDHTMRVRIIGHTDSTGPDSVNDPLSVDRANAVKRYLESRGVDGSRIDTAGRGEHEPIADNSSEAGRARNRRVEIFLREPQQQG